MRYVKIASVSGQNLVEIHSFEINNHSTFLVSSLGILLTPDPVKKKKGVLQYDPQVETGDSSLMNASGPGTSSATPL